MTIEVNPYLGSATGAVISVNGQTGVVVLTAPDVGAEPAFTRTTDEFTLSSGDITAKQVTLSSTPLSPSSVVFVLQGQTGVLYGPDFTISGTTLSWSGLGLESILVAGSEFSVTYES